MKRNEFDAICQRYTIAPSIALENDNVRDCLYGMKNAGNDSAYNGYRNVLIRLLETEF